MKKILIMLALMISISGYSQTVVIERPGLFTDLTTALVGVPVVSAVGLVKGVAEAGRDLVFGSTTVVTNAPPVIPAVTALPATVIVAPNVVTKQVISAGGVVTTTTVGGVTSISTSQAIPGGVVNTQYTRPTSAYEVGTTIVPVPIENRVGTSVYVNPYVYRYK